MAAHYEWRDRDNPKVAARTTVHLHSLAEGEVLEGWHKLRPRETRQQDGMNLSADERHAWAPPWRKCAHPPPPCTPKPASACQAVECTALPPHAGPTELPFIRVAPAYAATRMPAWVREPLTAGPNAGGPHAGPTQPRVARPVALMHHRGPRLLYRTDGCCCLVGCHAARFRNCAAIWNSARIPRGACVRGLAGHSGGCVQGGDAGAAQAAAAAALRV